MPLCNPGSPGRVFCLNGETLFETVSRVEADAENLINISGMAGGRTVRVRAMLYRMGSSILLNQ